jgi:hypothetical protein
LFKYFLNIFPKKIIIYSNIYLFNAMNMGTYSENAPSMRPLKKETLEDGKDKDGFAPPGGKR